MSLLNLINPLIVKSARERLRPRNAISWGLVVVVVTGFVYFICYNVAGVQADLKHEQAAKFALVSILVMQGIILMLMGTGSVAIGIAQERMNGVLDYQRMTPMSPTSKILGYLIGLPIREYFLFSLTLPFVAYASVQSGIKISNLIHLYVVGFVSVWLYHMTGLVAGIVSPKPWRAGVATQGMVLLMYFVMPALASLGFTFFLYLTPRPVFARLAYEELALDDLRGVIDPTDLQTTVQFFNFNINPSVFTLCLQGFLILSLFTIVYRKWREESQHPFSKLYAVIVFLVTQVMLLGSLWPRLTNSEMIDNITERVHRMRLFDLRRVDTGGAVIFELLYVFFFVSLAMSLLLIGLITPTSYTFAKGLRRAKKLNHPRVSIFGDAASALPFGIIFIVLTCVSYALLVGLAIQSGFFFRHTPSALSLVLPPVLFAALVMMMQSLCHRFGLRGMLMAMFVLWVVPFLTFVLMASGNAPRLVTEYVGVPMPFNAFFYTLANLFHVTDGNIKGTALENTGKLTLFALVLNGGLAVIAVSLMFKQQSDIRTIEAGPPPSAPILP